MSVQYDIVYMYKDWHITESCPEEKSHRKINYGSYKPT